MLLVLVGYSLKHRYLLHGYTSLNEKFTHQRV